MNDKKISKNREKKEVIVAQLTEKAKRAKAFVFANYQGMTHKQIEDIKKGLKKVNAELVIAKNTLIGIALQKVVNVEKVDSGVAKAPQNDKKKSPSSTSSTSSTFSTYLEGPTATVFAYDDVVLPIKEIAKSIKALKLPLIKFGILDGKMLAEADVVRLSTLPSREVLLAQLVGGLKSPIYGLHNALSWNLRRFVMTLSAIEQKKA